MVEAYNFLASWQLYPEKGTYEKGGRPKSAFYKVELGEEKDQLIISMNWVSIEDQGFASTYAVIADNEEQPVSNIEIADTVTCGFTDLLGFETNFYKNGSHTLHVWHEITPKGLLKVTQKHFQPDGEPLTNTEIYHKQMSVLPYSSSVAGAVIRPNEEGIIRHYALTAMEEQTNMQLNQIRQQIELLAIQAKEIQHRKELSLIIYDAKLSFNPIIGQVYYLYEKDNGSHLVSMIGPKEWGSKVPYKGFVAGVKLLADHTWVEI